MNYFNVVTLDLTSVMWVYNVYQTLLNAAIVIIFAREIIVQRLPLWGLGVDRTPRGVWISFGVWMHYKCVPRCPLLDIVVCAR